MIKRLGLYDAFRSAMLNDPKGSRKDAFKHFLATMESDPRYLATLAEDYFDRAHANWKVEKIGDSYSLVGTAAVQRRTDVSAAERAEKQKRTADIVKQGVERIRQIILLDMVLPTGKKLRDSTGAECAKAGGFFSEVARYLKPTEVVTKHLNEAELRNIWSRFEKPVKGRRASLGVERETRIGA